MKVKVAAFGREEVINRIYNCAAGQTDIDIVPFIYQDASETAVLLEHASLCDIFLFTEIHAFLYVKEAIEKKRLPAVKITYDDYTVLTSLFYAKRRLQEGVSRLSVDMWHHHHIEEVFEKLVRANHEVYTHRYGNDAFAVEEIVAFHCRLWEEGKIDYALTSVKEVERRLNKKNIPASYMRIPDPNLEQAIREAKSIATLNKNDILMVAGSICMKQTQATDQEKEAVLQRLQQELQYFAEQTDASIIRTNEEQFMLFGTQKMLDYITGHYRDFPLLKTVKRIMKAPAAIGFGLGITAKEAETHARLALEKCNQHDSSNCYIVNERQDAIGPLGVKKEFDAAQLYQALIHNARLNNELSYNFIDFITRRNNEPFSSNDIATYYKVTKRSAERTINKLLGGEIISAVGEEKPYIKGRPRKLFQINME